MRKSTPMDHQSADRISAAAERDPESPTAESRFDDRAQDAADRNEEDDEGGTPVPGVVPDRQGRPGPRFPRSRKPAGS